MELVFYGNVLENIVFGIIMELLIMFGKCWKIRKVRKILEIWINFGIFVKFGIFKGI